MDNVKTALAAIGCGAILITTLVHWSGIGDRGITLVKDPVAYKKVMTYECTGWVGNGRYTATLTEDSVEFRVYSESSDWTCKELGSMLAPNSVGSITIDKASTISDPVGLMADPCGLDSVCCEGEPCYDD